MFGEDTEDEAFEADTEALGAEEAEEDTEVADEGSQQAADSPDTAEEGAAGTDTPGGGEDVPQGDDAAPAGTQAAPPTGKYRERLDLAEQQRDQAVDRLARQQAVVFERTCADAGLPLAVAKAAGLDTAKFIGEDGLINTEALSTVADEIRAENGISRRPQPNPLVGQGRRSDQAESLGDVLREVARGSH